MGEGGQKVQAVVHLISILIINIINNCTSIKKKRQALDCPSSVLVKVLEG